MPLCFPGRITSGPWDQKGLSYEGKKHKTMVYRLFPHQHCHKIGHPAGQTGNFAAWLWKSHQAGSCPRESHESPIAFDRRISLHSSRHVALGNAQPIRWKTWYPQRTIKRGNGQSCIDGGFEFGKSSINRWMFHCHVCFLEGRSCCYWSSSRTTDGFSSWPIWRILVN